MVCNVRSTSRFSSWRNNSYEHSGEHMKMIYYKLLGIWSQISPYKVSMEHRKLTPRWFFFCFPQHKSMNARMCRRLFLSNPSARQLLHWLIWDHGVQSLRKILSGSSIHWPSVCLCNFVMTNMGGYWPMYASAILSKHIRVVVVLYMRPWWSGRNSVNILHVCERTGMDFQLVWLL